MKTLIIINDPPYGTERVYNALRLAHALQKKEPEHEVTVFLMADAVTAAKAGQKTPEGYYNVERMLRRVLSRQRAACCCVEPAWTRADWMMPLSWRVPAAVQWMSSPRRP